MNPPAPAPTPALPRYELAGAGLVLGPALFEPGFGDRAERRRKLAELLSDDIDAPVVAGGNAA